MNNKVFCVVFIFTLLTFSLSGQEITQVRQDGKLIVVEYTINEDAGYVDLYVSQDEGLTFRGPLKYVAGDTKAVTAGNKSICWNPIREFNELNVNDLRFKLVSKMKRVWEGEKNTFIKANVSYSAAPQFAYGLTFGQVNRFGWYISLMSGASFNGFSADLTCDEHNMVDGKTVFFSGEKSGTRLSAMGGCVIKFVPSLAMTMGVGYGNRILCWQTEDGQWVKNDRYSVQGLEAAIGLQCDINGFILSAEAVTTNLKVLETKFGIGYAF